MTATFWKEKKILKDIPKELETKFRTKNQHSRVFLKATIAKIHGIVNPLVDFWLQRGKPSPQPIDMFRTRFFLRGTRCL